jgi:hypothetical protein
LLDKLYPAPRWRKTLSGPRTNHATKGKRVEVLWTNYNPQKINHYRRRACQADHNQCMCPPCLGTF